jgi:hypothetical protein
MSPVGHDSWAGRHLNAAHSELVVALNDIDEPEYTIVSNIATIIDHAKRVLGGQDRGYRLEKLHVLESAVARLRAELELVTCGVCNGRGYQHDPEFDCRRCGGSGRVKP